MFPLRPPAIATPGATASSIAVFTILSSLAGNAVSRPELFKPIWGPTYFMGTGTAAMRAGGVGAAQETPAIRQKRAIEEKDFMSQGEGTRSTRRAASSPACGSLSKTTVMPPDNPCFPLGLSARVPGYSFG